jgi:glyoxylase-like metal-dependent hydrolase (beta-lactamase superfamily II)/rhodanese-related sulfurtransferase
MFFRQLVNEDLLCASYVIADDGDAVVVDPAFDVTPYLALAEQHSFAIRHVIETHVHADHVSGGRLLAAATGASIHLSSLGGVSYPHRAFEEGESLTVGSVELAALPTPGHRPEHLAIVVTDRDRSANPCLVLTGDSLLVGDVARPDLAVDGGDEVLAAARTLRQSLNRIASLDISVEIWPGHLGGSLCCGAGVSERNASTVGFEQASNPALWQSGPRGFSDWLIHNLPVRPPTVERVVELNRGEIDAGSALLQPLSPGDVQRLGLCATVLDGRSAHAFDIAHIPRSICIEADRTGAGTRAAWAADPGGPVVVVADSNDQAGRFARSLLSVGFTDIAGFLAGGIAAWVDAGGAVRSTACYEVEAAADLVWRDEVTLVDVRESSERTQIVVPGSAHVPWRELRRRAHELPTERPLLAVCASGRRTAIAASLIEHVLDVPVARIAGGGVEDLAPYRIVIAAQ